MADLMPEQSVVTGSNQSHRSFVKLVNFGTAWPAAGLMDTEMRCFIELEEQDATKEVQPRVQA